MYKRPSARINAESEFQPYVIQSLNFSFASVRGGWSSPNTTEYFDGNSKSWRPFVAMANARRRHCIVGYKDSFILIGGTDTGSMVEQFNLTTSKWTSLPPLTTFRDRWG